MNSYYVPAPPHAEMLLLNARGHCLSGNAFWTAGLLEAFWTAGSFLDCFWTTGGFLEDFWTAGDFVEDFWTAGGFLDCWTASGLLEALFSYCIPLGSPKVVYSSTVYVHSYSVSALFVFHSSTFLCAHPYGIPALSACIPTNLQHSLHAFFCMSIACVLIWTASPLCAFLLCSSTVGVHFYCIAALFACFSIIPQHCIPALYACISTIFKHFSGCIYIRLYVFVCSCTIYHIPYTIYGMLAYQKRRENEHVHFLQHTVLHTVHTVLRASA